MSSLDSKSLNELVKRLASQVIKETLAPIREMGDNSDAEVDRQQRQIAATKDALRNPRKSPKSPKETDEDDLAEADDEEEGEDSDDTESKPKSDDNTVSKKIATGKSEPKQNKAVIPDPTEIKDVTFNQVVNMMNMMRSGKSSKDPETQKSLNAYFKGLNAGEKQALFVLLSGLTQILAGGVSGESAPDPSQVGIKIKPRQAEKDVATPSSKSKSKDTPGSTSSVTKKLTTQAGTPLPIVVGEASDKSQIHKKLMQLRVKS